MRGEDERSGSLFSYVDLEARVGQSHPLRAIRALVNEALAVLVSDFSALYSPIGRPSIPPGRLLRAMLLQRFCPVRPERRLWARRGGIAGRLWTSSSGIRHVSRVAARRPSGMAVTTSLSQPKTMKAVTARPVHCATFRGILWSPLASGRLTVTGRTRGPNEMIKNRLT